MFAGFNANITEQGIMSPFFRDQVLDWFEAQKNTVHKELSSYVLGDGVIDETKLEDEWFPSIYADVFISHSHKDQDLAIGLAGWLYEIFGIKSFIDSCVWGYADDLLKIIDNEYCVDKWNRDGSIDTYSYQKRNHSTAHVHMILNTALHKMIDKAECLIFLNTPNSLPIDEVINATLSPWIYSELIFSRLVRKKKLIEYRSILQHDDLSQYSQKELIVKYDVLLDHLETLNDQDLFYLWSCGRNEIKDPLKSLDCLYEYKGLIGKG